MSSQELGQKRKRPEEDKQEKPALRLSGPEKALAKADEVYANILYAEAEKIKEVRKPREQIQEFLNEYFPAATPR